MKARTALSRDLILRTAVRLADEHGLDATSMRRLAQELQVTPMALYKHVANREELIDGMVDTVIAEVTRVPVDTKEPDQWRAAIRSQILAARVVLVGRPWATGAIETRKQSSPAALAYMDMLMGIMRSGGLSIDLVHHAMHALSSRMWGLTRDVFPTPALPNDPTERDSYMEQAAVDYPHIMEMVNTLSVANASCNAEAEFQFSLDVLLDGFEDLHQAGWTPVQR